MTDNRPVTMRARFLGGPADGGELTLAEPIRRCLRFPLSPLEAVDMLETHRGTTHPIPNHVPAHYVLDTDMLGDPARDSSGRVTYRYRVANPIPKETPHD